MKAVFGFLVLFLVSFQVSWAQEENDSTKQSYWKDHFTFGGYIKYMNTNSFVNLNQIATDNLFHNRLNLKYYINNNWTAKVEMRNRIFYGASLQAVPNYANSIGLDAGAVDLSFNVINEPGLLFNSTIDRANIEFNKGKWNVKLGRQRINWGINLAWNPNDLFNAYNFVDFDYTERPGSDAARVTYYATDMSQIELAYRPGKTMDESTLAALYKFNKWRYDIQFIAANYRTDLAAGFGFAGNIWQAGFKGEGTYFHPKNNLSDTNGVFTASISSDYTFGNGLYLNLSGYYNSGAGGFNSLAQLSTLNTLSAKNLLPTEFAGFVQVSKAFTPIFGAGISIMYLPGINGVFAIPTLNYSIAQNWSLDFIGQILFAEVNNKFTNASNSLFMRLMWSF
ncbi:MAG: hypothetical protein R3279_02960 [Putridiphycobacter sp.]|nr:hypothetical protein [Putridiphycobacter sp.]